MKVIIHDLVLKSSYIAKSELDCRGNFDRGLYLDVVKHRTRIQLGSIVAAEPLVIPEQIPFDEGESVPVDPRAVVTAIDDEVDGHTVIFAWRDHSTPFHAFDLSMLGDVAAAGSSAPGAGWAVLRGESKLQTGDLIGPHGWEER